MANKPTSIELCAGAGGQAIGIDQAGFRHLALVEIDRHCCKTLKANKRSWRGLVNEAKLSDFDASRYRGVDLLAAGLPCPPFSKAGKQLGAADERNLFPDALKIIKQCEPRAVMIENVRGILDSVFEDFRNNFKHSLEEDGYIADFRLLNASDFGVPQLRPRVVFVALKEELWPYFKWPQPSRSKPQTVGKALYELMAENGWKNARQWEKLADSIAPTVVGGSKKHGGPDLGPTRAKRAWAALHVNCHIIADAAPPRDFVGIPALTVGMVARLQGFPANWKFEGKKTNAYRQVGNAFPPPVAKAVARQIRRALAKDSRQLSFEHVA
jgi:DNA (cytosine-5)-methyltransferase 1